MRWKRKKEVKNGGKREGDGERLELPFQRCVSSFSLAFNKQAREARERAKIRRRVESSAREAVNAFLCVSLTASKRTLKERREKETHKK